MKLKIIRHLLSWLGVAGVGATAYLSVKCSKKAEEKDTPKQKLIAYGPAIASGMATSACILASDRIASKEIAALAAGCACIATSRNQFERHIKKALGKKELLAAKRASEKEIAPWEGPSIEWTGKGTTLVLDGYSGRLFYSSKAEVEAAQERFNQRRANGERLSLNNLYEEYGIQLTHFGALHGWPTGGECGNDPIRFVNYDDVDEHGSPMILIDIYDSPTRSWMEDHEYAEQECGRGDQAR